MNPQQPIQGQDYQNQPSVPSGGNNNRPQKKKNVLNIILIASLVIFLIIGGNILWDEFVRDNDSEETTEETATNNNATDDSNIDTENQIDNGTNESGDPPQASNVDSSVYQSCLSQTKDEAECKDCCDCLDADENTRKSCRDACPNEDFDDNTDFITVDAQSVLGPNGDYSTCTGLGNEQECKQCCDTSSEYSCGDFRFCRDACVE